MSSLTSSITSQRPGRWKPSTSSPSSSCAERVLELVAVAQLLHGGHDRLDRRVLEAADALERVAHLGLLLARAGARRAAPATARPGAARRARSGRGWARAARRCPPRRTSAWTWSTRARTRSPGTRPADEHDVAARRGPRRRRRGRALDLELELVAAAGAGASGCLGIWPSGSMLAGPDGNHGPRRLPAGGRGVPLRPRPRVLPALLGAAGRRSRSRRSTTPRGPVHARGRRRAARRRHARSCSSSRSQGLIGRETKAEQAPSWPVARPSSRSSWTASACPFRRRGRDAGERARPGPPPGDRARSQRGSPSSPQPAAARAAASARTLVTVELGWRERPRHVRGAVGHRPARARRARPRRSSRRARASTDRPSSPSCTSSSGIGFDRLRRAGPAGVLPRARRWTRSSRRSGSCRASARRSTGWASTWSHRPACSSTPSRARRSPRAPSARRCACRTRCTW